MYVKIVNHEREESPRRRADLRRLFRYLFTPQLIMKADGGRLLGPPELMNVLVCEFPSGPAIERVADDLAEQFYAYTQEALVCQNGWSLLHPLFQYAHQVYEWPFGSMPFCVELDNLKDTDAPIHQPAAMLVAAD